LQNKSRFNTFMDRTYTVYPQSAQGNGTPTIGSGGMNINDAFYKKCNIPIEFSGATGAITEIRSNNVGLLVISRNGTAGFASQIRVRFSDG